MPDADWPWKVRPITLDANSVELLSLPLGTIADRAFSLPPLRTANRAFRGSGLTGFPESQICFFPWKVAGVGGVGLFTFLYGTAKIRGGPYQLHDILWVRERHKFRPLKDNFVEVEYEVGQKRIVRLPRAYEQAATGWRSPWFLPKWAVRIWLRIEKRTSLYFCVSRIGKPKRL